MKETIPFSYDQIDRTDYSQNRFGRGRRSAKLETLQDQQQQQRQQQQQQQQQLRDQQQREQQQRPRQPIAVSSTSPPVSQITERQLRQRQHSRTNYHEDEYGPASEFENDRQQRVYRGQPSTIGQVQRDRDGLRRNIISVSPGIKCWLIC